MLGDRFEHLGLAHLHCIEREPFWSALPQLQQHLTLKSSP
jgi:hypothetical protein